jgi:hypothetical protein
MVLPTVAQRQAKLMKQQKLNAFCPKSLPLCCQHGIPNVVAAGLLAPVPESHLIGGIDVCREQGKVAFGTRVWEALHDLEQEAGIGAPVLIYASHASEHSGARLSWVAKFAGWVAASRGSHPSGQSYRPISTQENNEDQSGHWLGFWEVTELR